MILVTGASGQLGTAFARQLGDEAALLSREDLDLAEVNAIAPKLDQFHPRVLINCAAYTRVDDAEDDVATAVRINSDAVRQMALWASRRNVRFVTFSTDYVFDGTKGTPYVESDSPTPINAYGFSKYLGEVSARWAHPYSLLIRTSWIISGSHRNFVSAILERSGKSGELSVVDDQYGCPTIANDLAYASLQAIERGVTGVLHLVNEGPTTWYELARTAVRLADPGAPGPSPIASAAYPTKAKRPGYSVLGSERLGALGLSHLPNWRESLPDLIREMKGWLFPGS